MNSETKGIVVFISVAILMATFLIASVISSTNKYSAEIEKRNNAANVIRGIIKEVKPLVSTWINKTVITFADGRVVIFDDITGNDFYIGKDNIITFDGWNRITKVEVVK